MKISDITAGVGAKASSCLMISLLSVGVAHANVLLEGDFIQTQISDDGTLGDGGSDPGLVYDVTGTGTFDSNFDYVAPGDPFEGFAIRYVGTDGGEGFLRNDNSLSNGNVGSSESFTSTSLTDISASSEFDNHARWEGGNSLFGVIHDFFFNDDDERVNIRTTLTALADFVSVLFSRAVDPDPDSRSEGTASTNNQRGIDANTDGDFDDDGDVSPENFVGSLGSVSGTPLGLFADTDFTQNTGIANACCSQLDPSFYLGGGDLGLASTGDDGIGIAFDLGTLLTGESVTVNYAYVTGEDLSSVDLPDDPIDPDPDPDPDPGPVASVPVPSTIGLLLLALVTLRRRVTR